MTENFYRRIRRMGEPFFVFARFNSIHIKSGRDEWFKSTETNVPPSRDGRREFLSRRNLLLARLIWDYFCYGYFRGDLHNAVDS